MAERKETANNGLFDTWTTFSKEMEDRIVSSIQDQQTEYQDLYEKWQNLNTEIGTTLSETLKSRNVQTDELYNVWKNYANQIQSRLAKLNDTGKFTLTELQGQWKDYADKITKQIFTLKDGDKGAESLYWTWVEFSNRFGKELSQVAAGKRVQIGELASILTEFNETVQGIIGTTAADNEALYKDFRGTWQTVSAQLRKNLQDALAEHEKEYDTIRNVWLRQTEQMGQEISNFISSLSSNYEELYKHYLDRTASLTENLYPFQFMRVRQLEAEVADLRSKLSEIERRVDKKK